MVLYLCSSTMNAKNNVLVIMSIRRRRENQPPASLGLSYFREER